MQQCKHKHAEGGDCDGHSPLPPHFMWQDKDTYTRS